MPFRFVHSADIHLDSPLKSLALRNPALADLIFTATRQAFVSMVSLCIDEGVDALLLSGDLYDGDQTSMKTARFFAEQMRRLSEAGIKVFVLRGNHDALSKITKELILPESVVVFGGRAEAVHLDRGDAGPDVVIHGISYSSPKAAESLLSKFKPAVTGAVNIGMLHTSLGGAPGHDIYAPCTVGELDGFGYDYWALGHIHKRSIAVGKATVVMAGNPQGRDINEAGLKSVSLVTVFDDKAIQVEERSVSIAQFERLDVEVASAADWRELVGRVGAAMRAARHRTATPHLIVRLRLTGASAMAWQIRRDIDLLQTDIEVDADLIGQVWLEKIELAILPPMDASQGETDTVGELRKLIGDQVRGSAGFQALARDVAEDLLKSLPAEVRGQFGEDETERGRLLDRLAAEGADDVLARLQGIREMP